jgi:NADPH-dependent 2,4-dienoyl-CoA reductase/sulfur reductase-like enzyme
VVVIGASFIGMEAAASLTQRGVEPITVVAPDEVPFERTLGARIGSVLQQVHAANGVRFELGRHVARLEGSNGTVTTVVLDNGATLEAGLVLMGVGVRPRTDAVEGVELEEDGSVLVDELMRLADGVYAAGDIATFPDWRTGEPTRIEHWRTAQQQGIVAGRNLAGQVQTFRDVPFFWTMQFDATLGYVGHASSWDDEILHGSLAERDYVLYYLRGDRLLAAAAMGRDRQLSALHELMRLGREPAASELREAQDLDLVERLRQVAR